MITGATSGIGKACAEKFAQHGWKLILTGRRDHRLKELQTQLETNYQAKVLSLCFDIQDRNAVKTICADLPKPWQNIHTLINNAGLAAGFAPFQESDIDDFEQMIDTNIKGLIYITRALLPGMIERGEGDIINIGSIAGHEVYPKGHVYCATKHAVNALTQGLRQDTLGTGIRVCSVDPGAADTEFSLVRFKGASDKAKQVYKGMHPLQAEDVAEAVYFCSSSPRHVCIADMILLPTAQAQVTMIHRDSE